MNPRGADLLSCNVPVVVVVVVVSVVEAIAS